MMTILETDLYGMGKPEVILESSSLKVIISPHLGGRIVNVSAGSKNFLFTSYPEGDPSGFYSEYGGIEEFLDRPPGYLWSRAWWHEIEEEAVKLRFRSDRIFLEKRISLDEAVPVLKIEYSILNTGPNLVKHSFGIHSEICLDNDAESNNYHIPTQKGILSGGSEQTKKRYVHPSQGWCAATGKESLVAMFFPDKLLDGVEVYYPTPATHLNLSPLIYYVGLSPGKEARFTCAMYFGEGNVDFAIELREDYADKLPREYTSATEDRLAMARSFEPPESMKVAADSEESEERQYLLERMEKLSKRKAERMAILEMLREKQIDAAEALRQLNLMNENTE